MKEKAKLRFAILMVVIMAMMTALIMQLGTLTLTEGKAYAEKALSRRTTTTYTTGARGRILDRNGIPLAYDKTSYNVQFMRDPERLSVADSALYTESLLKAISIIEAGGGSMIDTFYIKKTEDGTFQYSFGVEREKSPATWTTRYRDFCNAMGFSISEANADNPDKWISAEKAYLALRESWQIPPELSYEQAVKLMSIRQETNLNKWRAYEPVTIAYNVPMEVVAQLDMLADELLGVKTVQSTARVYPWGHTASHILGYLGRQVDKMSVSNMERMGYTSEDYSNIADIFAKDENGAIETDGDGNPLVMMTKLGYSYNDYIGVAGVEKTMEKYLTANTTAQRGTQSIEVNKHGSITRELEKTASSNGSDVMLTIDLPLQVVTETALKDAIEKIRAYEEELILTKSEKYLKLRPDLSKIHKAETGSIVVLDIHSGQTLAMASYPDFDPNRFIAGLSPDDVEDLFGENSNMPTLNRAIASRLSPGSIFKMSTGLAGLMESVITLDTRIVDEGPYLRNNIFDEKEAPSCWADDRHGGEALNLERALTLSCNYYFFTVANDLGIDKLNNWSGRLGLNSNTGIELPGEVTSHVGGQSVLYDNTKPLSEQKSSLPAYVNRQLKILLEDIMKSSGREYTDEMIAACSLKLLALQDGGDSQEFGEGIRRALRDELGIPVTLTRAQNWVSRISSYLVELKWKPSMSVTSGIGQATIVTTPIAIARYASTFGNEGTVYDVHIVDRILNENGTTMKTFDPVVHDKIDAPEEYWTAIRRGLQGVVSPEDGGTAAKTFSAAFQEKYMDRIIGKTGTAQISLAYNNVDIENTSWFVCLLPREDPEIVIITCLPYGLSGSQGGGPAIEAIASFYLDRKDGAAKDNLVPVNGLIP